MKAICSVRFVQVNTTIMLSLQLVVWEPEKESIPHRRASTSQCHYNATASLQVPGMTIRESDEVKLGQGQMP